MGKEKELFQFSNTLKLITENTVYSTNLSQKEILKYLLGSNKNIISKFHSFFPHCTEF